MEGEGGKGERRGTARQGASLSRKLSQDGAKGTCEKIVQSGDTGQISRELPPFVAGTL